MSFVTLEVPVLFMNEGEELEGVKEGLVGGEWPRIVFPRRSISSVAGSSHILTGVMRRRFFGSAAPSSEKGAYDESVLFKRSGQTLNIVHGLPGDPLHC